LAGKIATRGVLQGGSVGGSVALVGIVVTGVLVGKTKPVQTGVLVGRTGVVGTGGLVTSGALVTTSGVLDGETSGALDGETSGALVTTSGALVTGSTIGGGSCVLEQLEQAGIRVERVALQDAPQVEPY